MITIATENDGSKWLQLEDYESCCALLEEITAELEADLPFMTLGDIAKKRAMSIIDRAKERLG